MSRLFPYSLLLIFFPLTIGTANGQEENIYDYQHSLEYASYMMKTRRYQPAIAELERLHFMKPNHDSLRLELLRAYRLGEEYRRGAFKVQSWYPPGDSVVLKKMPTPFLREYARVLILWDGGTMYLPGTIQGHGGLTAEEKQFYLINNELLRGDWDLALDRWKRTPIAKPEYQSLFSDWQERKHKSPGWAMALSTVLPGSGKLYTGDWKDAALSVLTIGTMGWQAYNGFNRDGVSSPYGWIFGSLGFGFYVGNIYGSFRAAKKYNRNVERRFQDRAMRLFRGSDGS